MEPLVHSGGLIKVVNKWKWHLLTLVFLSSGLAYLFSSPLFITPLYKSIGVVYPLNIKPFSEESPSEQMLQTFRSDEIRDSVISKFNLFEHYEIPTDTRFPNTTLFKKFNQNISFNRTEYESIEINVYDSDPLVASQIATYAIELYNRKMQRLKQGKAMDLMRLEAAIIHSTEREGDTLESKLTSLREEFGIISPEEQSASVTKEYLRSVSGGRGNSEAKKMLVDLAKNAGYYEQLHARKEALDELFADIKVEYEKSVAEIAVPLNYVALIAKPYPAEKSIFPNKLLIVIVAAFTMLCLGILAVYYIENRSNAN